VRSGYERRETELTETIQQSKAVHIITYGCALNKADTEIIRSRLLGTGYNITRNLDEADIVIVNTCGVKQSTENRVLKKIRELSSLSKEIIIAGCLPKISLDRIKKAGPSFAAIVGPEVGPDLHKIVRRVENGEEGIVLLDRSDVGLEVYERGKESRFYTGIGIVPISRGCVGECTYCCVRFARGRIRSLQSDKIISEVSNFLEDNCREIWLTGQDTAAYGLGPDSKENLPGLIDRICELPFDFRIRVGMMNPKNALSILDELISAYGNPKMYKFIHLPIQSGDDEILRLMGREYTVDDFKYIVESFREVFPRITLSIDMIVGFPGETEKNFENSLSLIEEIKPDIVNISRFGIRPRTKASEMPGQIPGWKTKGRSRRMTDIVRKTSYMQNRGWVGWHGLVLISELGTKGGVLGRNFSYKPILIDADEGVLNQFVEVEITDAKTGYLEANLI